MNSGKNMNYAPIVIFAYKRLDKITNCINSIKNNIDADKSDVYVFSDGYKSDNDKSGVLAVRKYLAEMKANHPFNSLTIIEQSKNNGLANSIIDGVSHLLEKYERVIVLEDDLVLHPDCIRYMNEALEYYNDNPNYGSISAYSEPLTGLDAYPHDVYVLKKGDCWGWATWRNRWICADWELSSFKAYLKDKARRHEFSHLQYDLEDQLWWQYEGKSDTWAARWLYSMYMNDLWTVYPKESLITNQGFDGSGENCESLNDTKNHPQSFHNTTNHQSVHFEALEPDASLQEELYQRSIPDSSTRQKYVSSRIKRKIRRFIHIN